MKVLFLFTATLAAMALVSAAAEAKPDAEPRLRMQLDLSDGSTIIGVPTIESVPIQTSYAKVKVPLKQVRIITIGDDHETAAADLRNGDKLNGVIALEPIKLETLFGVVSVRIDLVRSLRVVVSRGRISEALMQGLVLYYPFDQDDGDKVTDQSGKDNAGNTVGTKWGQDESGKGVLDFDGTDAHVDIRLKNTIIPTDNLTFNLWFKSAAVQRQPNPVLFFYGDSSSGQALYVHLTTSAAGSREHAVAIGNWADYVHTSEANVWKNDNWHMLTVTRSTSETRAYLDAKLVATQSPPKDIAGNTLRLSGIDTSHGFAGRMDEVSVFNATLSASDVVALYEAR